MNDAENIMLEKQQLIEGLQSENDILKLEKKQISKSEKKCNSKSYNRQIEWLQEQVKQLKAKQQQMKQNEIIETKRFLQQQSHLVQLEEKYRFLCQQLKISSSLNFTTQEHLTNLQKNKDVASVYLQRNIKKESQINKQQFIKNPAPKLSNPYFQNMTNENSISSRNYSKVSLFPLLQLSDKISNFEKNQFDNEEALKQQLQMLNKKVISMQEYNQVLQDQIDQEDACL